MNTHTHSRWLIIFHGILSLIFGILVIFNPKISVEILVLLFAAYVFIMGITTLIYAISQRNRKNNWITIMLEGLLGIVVGIMVWLWPVMTLLVLLYIIAFWAIFLGALQFINAIRFKTLQPYGFLLGLIGILSVVLGIYILVYPTIALAFIGWLIGLYATLYGTFFLLIGLSMRSSQP